MRLNVIHIILVLVMAAVLGNTTSCRKQQKVQTVGGELKFSDDTLSFDTVFTAAGSFTTQLLIYNPQNEEVILSSVRLKAGGSSYFHLNVDGFKGNNIPNIRIAAHDSVYVFATVNINPNDSLTPFVVTDSLVASLNGKEFYVPFMAYGQNAHYMDRDSINTNITWLTDKPYVVLHPFVVGPQGTLNIPTGCRVYMHQDARFFVYGQFNAGTTGSSTDSVLFQGDRLDRRYFGFQGYPGEWGGIYFVPGSAGRITRSIIKNCGGATRYWNYSVFPAAIEVDTAAALFIDHSVVKNSIGYGLLSYSGNVVATNCLFAATGAYAMAVIQGGYDSLTNCTFANDGGTGLTHSATSTLAVLNYYSPDGRNYFYGDLNGVMRNCIVYGTLDSEVVFSSAPNAAANFRVDHCLLKMGTVRDPFVTYTGCLFNQDPLFANTNQNDYHLQDGSPAIDSGIPWAGIGSTDLDDKPRENRTIDMGCYEH
jgi:hypothetical protein